MLRSRRPTTSFDDLTFADAFPQFQTRPFGQPFADPFDAPAVPRTFVLPRQEEPDFAELMAALRQRAQQYRATAPGFFTPYRNKSDFALSLTAPVLAPLALGLLAAVSAAAAAIAAAVCVGSLVVAGFSALAGAKSVRDASLNLALLSGIITGVATLLTPVLAIAAAVSLPVSIVKLATRSGATVVDAAKKACASDEGVRRVESEEVLEELHSADHDVDGSDRPTLR
ncbi:hypothetical protein [Legionella nagasakiensis]|uniref:hypothetical protein n=1 Tax=Legionella nagasakiensis TaxID=535290 RepID=UPI00105658F2|nr:hypothetical protein [Legionella nagasakiensis]